MPARRPNIVLIMADDHAAHAVSAYGSTINETPNIDRIAAGGLRFDRFFCTNSLCAPSRATFLTGTYNHVNGVTTLWSQFDAAQPTFPSLLRAAGYATALFGKWHLGHGAESDPQGFDRWVVLPGQGDYHDPEMYDEGRPVRLTGYVTDLITDQALDWIGGLDADQPFCVLVQHKAPHRSWEPDAAHAKLYEDDEIPAPYTWDDDYSFRASAARNVRMRVRRDLTEADLKEPVPAGLDPEAEAKWKYQRYIKDYLRCVASLDDNVGRLLDALDAAGLAEDTIVVYTSDQGFFLGDHGWYDKRLMFEESLRMPFVVRYPRLVEAGSTTDAMCVNADLAQTLLDLAGVEAHPRMQGRSMRPVLEGATPADWRTSIYYRYWEHLDSSHAVPAHYGVRTERHKLVFYYGAGLGQAGASDERTPPEWELFDLVEDPYELHSVYDDPAYADVVAELTAELARLQQAVGDDPFEEVSPTAPR